LENNTEEEFLIKKKKKKYLLKDPELYKIGMENRSYSLLQFL